MKHFALTALLALAACAGPSAARSAAEARLSYGRLNEDIRVGGMTIRPLTVVEDSRCPAAVACVWGGRVVLRLRVAGMRGDQTISSIAPLTLPGGGVIELASVAPPRTNGRPRIPLPYRFGFRRR